MKMGPHWVRHPRLPGTVLYDTGLCLITVTREYNYIKALAYHSGYPYLQMNQSPLPTIVFWQPSPIRIPNQGLLMFRCQFSTQSFTSKAVDVWVVLAGSSMDWNFDNLAESSWNLFCLWAASESNLESLLPTGEKQPLYSNLVRLFFKC